MVLDLSRLVLLHRDHPEHPELVVSRLWLDTSGLRLMAKYRRGDEEGRGTDLYELGHPCLHSGTPLQWVTLLVHSACIRTEEGLARNGKAYPGVQVSTSIEFEVYSVDSLLGCHIALGTI